MSQLRASGFVFGVWGSGCGVYGLGRAKGVGVAQRCDFLRSNLGILKGFLVSSECMYGSSATLVKVCLGSLEWDAGCYQH